MNKQCNLTKTFFLAVILSVLAFNSNGQSLNSSYAVMQDSTNNKISLRYLGTESGMMVIAVRYNNTTGDRFNLTISNASGDILFRNCYNDKTFDKKFRIPNEHGDVRLAIVDANSRLSETVSVLSVSQENGDVVTKDLK